jgi:hypothetical protein
MSGTFVFIGFFKLWRNHPCSWVFFSREVIISIFQSFFTVARCPR